MFRGRRAQRPASTDGDAVKDTQEGDEAQIYGGGKETATRQSRHRRCGPRLLLLCFVNRLNLFYAVAHRTRQFEESLANVLDNFKNHHEGHVLRVPRLVRSITMGEFADKYNGDINECLRGLQKERQGGEPVPVDPVLKKRKWVANEDGPGPEDAECSRAPKNGEIPPGHV